MSFASRLRRITALVTWHRRMGLTAAVFVLVLAVTGLTLNHTDDLGLHERHLAAGWLLNWYGIEAPQDADSYVLSYGVVTRLGDRLYLDTRLVEQDVGTIAGAVTSEDLVIVAVDGDLLLLTADGERVERLGREDGLPQGVDGLGFDPANRVLLRSSDGLYRADPALLSWDRVGDDPDPIRWARPGATDEAMLAALRADYLASILTLERVLLDLHSGRIFGRFGPWLMDLAAVLLLVLAVTGICVWSLRRD